MLEDGGFFLILTGFRGKGERARAANARTNIYFLEGNAILQFSEYNP